MNRLIYMNRVGTDIIFHLLTQTSLFIALPNNCYCQLVGEPILSLKARTQLGQTPASDTSAAATKAVVKSLKRPREADNAGERPTKRLKIIHSVPTAAPQVTGRPTAKVPLTITARLT